MADKKETRIVEMQFENKDFEKNAEKSLKTLDVLEKKLEFKGVDQGAKNINNALNGINVDALNNALDKVNYRFSTLGMITSTVLTKSVGALGSKILGIFEMIDQKGTSRALNLENAQFKLEGLISAAEGGSKRVKEILDGPVNDAVSGTRFGLDEAAVAASNLYASGIKTNEELGKSLKSIAGAASMTGSEFSDMAQIFSTVKSNGRLMTMQLNQFSLRGLNLAAELANTYGTTEAAIREMASAGKISYDMLVEATQRFVEQSARANETYEGALKNVQAALGRIGVLFKANQLEATRKVLVSLIDGDNAPLKAIQKNIKFMADEVNHVTNLFSKWVVEILKSEDTLRIIEDLGVAFENLTYFIWEIARGAVRAFDAIFPKGTILRAVEGLTSRFADLTAQLRKWNKTSSWLPIFKMFFSILKAGATIVSTLYNVIKPLFAVIGFGIDLIGRGAIIISEFVSTVLNSIVNSGLLQSIGNLFTVIGKKIFGTSKIFKKIGDTIHEFIMNLIPGEDILTNFFKILTKYIDSFAEAIENANIPSVMDGIEASIAGVGTFIANFAGFDSFASMAEAAINRIKVAFGELKASVMSKALPKFEKIFDFAATVKRSVKELHPLESVLGILRKAGERIKWVFDRVILGIRSFNFALGSIALARFSINLFRLIRRLRNPLVDIKDSLCNAIEQISMAFKEKPTDTMIKFAVALAMIAGSLFLVSKIKADRLWASVGAIGAIAGMLTVFTKVISSGNVIEKGKQLVPFGQNLILFAGAVWILVQAMTSMAAAMGDNGQNWQNLVIAFVMVSALMWEMVGLMAVIDKANINPAALVGVGLSLILFAAGIAILAQAMIKLSVVPWQELLAGMRNMFIVIAPAVVALGLLGLVGPAVVAAAIAIGIFAASVLLLAGSILIFSKLPMDLIYQGLINMITVMAPMLLILAGLAVAGTAALAGAAALLIVSASLIVLAAALAFMCALPLDTLVEIMKALSITLLLFAVALGIVGLAGPAAIAGAAGMLVLSLAIGVLAVALLILSAVPIEHLTQMLIALGIAFVAFAAVSVLLALVAPGIVAVASAFLAFALAVIAVGIAAQLVASAFQKIVLACQLVQLIDAKKVFDNLKDISAGLALLAVAGIALIPAAFPLLAVGIALALMAVSTASLVRTLPAFTDALLDLNKQDIEGISKNLIKLGDGFKAMGESSARLFVIAASISVLTANMLLLPHLLKSGTKQVDDFGVALNKFSNTVNKINFTKVIENFDLFTRAVTYAMNSMSESIKKSGEAFTISFVKGMLLNLVMIVTACTSIKVSILKAFKDIYSDTLDIGKNFVNGLRDGINQNREEVREAAYNLGILAKTATEEALDEHSPSKEMFKVGMNATLGLVNGMKSLEGRVAKTGSGIGLTVVSAIRKSVGNVKDYKDYMDGLSKNIKKFVNSSSLAKYAKLGNTLYLHSDQYKEDLKDLKDYSKEYRETYKKMQEALKKSKTGNANERDSAKKNAEQYKKDLEDIEKDLVKVGKAIAKGPEKAIKNFRKELKKTVKDYLAFNNLDLDNVLDFTSKMEKANNLGGGQSLIENLSGTLRMATEAAKSTSDAFDLLSASTDTGINLLERFDKVSSMTSRRLMINAKSQLKAYAEFKEGIAKLRDMGLDSQFVDELEKQGPSSLNYVRGFLKMSADEISEYNGYISQKQQYETEQMQKDMQDKVDAYEDYYSKIEQLAAKGLSEGIVRRLKEAGVEQASFVNALLGVKDFSEINSMYEKSVTETDKLAAATDTAKDTVNSFAELIQLEIKKKNLWSSMLSQLKDKGLSDELILYFKKMGYESAHGYVESVLKENETGIKAINDSYKQLVDEMDSPGETWLKNMKTSRRTLIHYNENMAKLADMLPNGEANPLYQHIKEMGVEDGAEYAEAFVNSSKDVQDRIVREFNKGQKENAKQLSDELHQRILKIKQWREDLQKLAEETYKKGKNKGESIIGTDLYAELVSMGPEAADKIHALTEMSHKELAEFAEDYNDAMKDLPGTVSKSVTDSYAAVAGDAVKAFKDKVSSSESEEELTNSAKKTITESAKKTKPHAKKKGAAVGEAAKDGVKEYVNESKGEQLASNMAAGLSKGFKDNTSMVKKAAIKLARAAYEAMEKELDVNSPSKKTQELGKFVDLGLAKGIQDYIRPVIKSAQGMTDQLDTALNGVLDGIQNGAPDAYTMRLDLMPSSTDIDLTGHLEQIESISNILGSIGNLTFDLNRDANRDVVTAINDMRSDFQSQFDGLSQTISEMQLVMDSGALVGQIANPMNEALGERIALAQRGVLA